MIVNDYQNYVRLGSDLKAVKSNAVLIANMVRQIYTQLNLEISIVFVHLHTFTDISAMGSLYTTTSYTMETYLNRLSDWRRYVVVETRDVLGIPSRNSYTHYRDYIFPTNPSHIYLTRSPYHI